MHCSDNGIISLIGARQCHCISSLLFCRERSVSSFRYCCSISFLVGHCSGGWERSFGQELTNRRTRLYSQQQYCVQAAENTPCPVASFVQVAVWFACDEGCCAHGTVTECRNPRSQIGSRKSFPKEICRRLQLFRHLLYIPMSRFRKPAFGTVLQELRDVIETLKHQFFS